MKSTNVALPIRSAKFQGSIPKKNIIVIPIIATKPYEINVKNFCGLVISARYIKNNVDGRKEIVRNFESIENT